MRNLVTFTCRAMNTVVTNAVIPITPRPDAQVVIWQAGSSGSSDKTPKIRGVFHGANDDGKF
ncbi:MAG TPA: hypothetical protein VGV15_08305 [Terriglobales bacterium]|nr:hypothetical protein [Terriglobales bacterium]